MKIKSLAVLTALSLCSALATAAPYQTEINGAYINFDDSDDFNLRAAYYFSPVESSGSPLAEEAFLGRASGVYLDYDRLESDFEPRDRVNVGLEYYIPNSIFYVGANVVHITELDDGFDSDGSDTDWGLTFGIAPIEGLLVTTSYRVAPKLHTPRLTQFIQYFTTIAEEDRSGYDFNLSAKYVAQLEGETAIKLTVTYADERWGDMVSIGADYFFDSTFSVGIWREDIGESTLAGYGIRTEKFFTPRFSVQASYADFDDLDLSILSVGAGVRF
ncbi:putative porin [Marinimicrobium sp. ABcell2]|uniref:putative porin n=1 Tax=Marinimicrobium sp. ABcell2 TaxID=3069751 RepID=UPI0027B6A615|nr:putative porin [Marinimicrobium sp. ABcell2]MDQ2075142.1 putative porin [Marinimicrobium sp. ABcell2]